MVAKSSRMMLSSPALASLALSKEHLAVLVKQGNLRAEGSSQSKLYYKLRFRMGPKQHVRYVGNNPVFVDQVRRELIRLQAHTKACRDLRRLIREANECLRRTKCELRSVLPLAGSVFYGREIRRRRDHGKKCVDKGTL